MYVNDPIGDFLTRIRNAQMAKHSYLRVPTSKIKQELANILLEEGFISSVEELEKEERNPVAMLEVGLKYNPKTNEPIISEIKRISKPGRKVYIKSKDLHPYKNGFGSFILTTSQGVMTDRKARTLNVGGELICSIW
ncbi:30S ribosomal protein S8 [bacterium]|nr:30S ribosomal protein S8 [bacterium]